MTRLRATLPAVAIVLCLPAQMVDAQEWPTKTVRIIAEVIPPAGGAAR